MQTISVRQANQNFSHYLSLVERGQEFVIAKRGQPVARLVMLADRLADDPAKQALALAQTRQKWREVMDSFKGSGIQGPFNRDDAYDEQS